MKNQNNYGTLQGSLQTAPHIRENQDGSKKVFLNVKVTSHGRTHIIPLQGFIPKSFKGNGPYGYLKAQETVFIEYTIKSHWYQDKLQVILQIDNIFFGKDLAKVKQPEPFAETASTEQKMNPEAPATSASIANEHQNIAFGVDLDF